MEINEDYKYMYDKYSLDINKPVVGLFGNLCWDATLLGHNPIFQDMFEVPKESSWWSQHESNDIQEAYQNLY